MCISAALWSLRKHNAKTGPYCNSLLCILFIPYFSLFLLPFLFIVYFYMYVFFSFDAAILVNKDVYKVSTHYEHWTLDSHCSPSPNYCGMTYIYARFWNCGLKLPQDKNGYVCAIYSWLPAKPRGRHIYFRLRLSVCLSVCQMITIESLDVK